MHVAHTIPASLLCQGCPASGLIASQSAMQNLKRDGGGGWKTNNVLRNTEFPQSACRVHEVAKSSREEEREREKIFLTVV